jgi:hypothetical protein
MLIHNYGLFWRRDDVFWGKPKKLGHLKGVNARGKSQVVDFRDQQGVYCLYDDNFRLVYVGQAGAKLNQRLLLRLRQHRSDALADRWTRFSWFGLRRVKETHQLAGITQANHTSIGQLLDHIEAILIGSVEPPHNRQGGKFGRRVKQYLQYRDEELLGPTEVQMVRALWKTHVAENI